MSRQPSAPLAAMARIRQMLRGGSREEPAPPPSSDSVQPLADQVAELRTRVAHLEQLVQGLQDSVHRSTERQDKRVSDMERRLDPAAIAAALSQNARERGL
jgi:TolA-binding protein